MRIHTTKPITADTAQEKRLSTKQREAISKLPHDGKLEARLISAQVVFALVRDGLVARVTNGKGMALLMLTSRGQDRKRSLGL